MNKNNISAGTSKRILKVFAACVIAVIAVLLTVFASMSAVGNARATNAAGTNTIHASVQQTQTLSKTSFEGSSGALLGQPILTGAVGSVDAGASNDGNTPGASGATGAGIANDAQNDAQNGADNAGMSDADVISAHDAYGSLTPADITTVPEENEGLSYAAGEVLLLFDGDTSLAQAQDILASLGLYANDASISVALDEDTMLRAFISADESVNSVLESARTQSGLSYAQPNFIYLPTDIGTDEAEAVESVSDWVEAADTQDSASVAEAADREDSASAVDTTEAVKAVRALQTPTPVTDKHDSYTLFSCPLTPSATEINDPYASAYQWHLPRIRAYDAWDIQRGEDALSAVAVIDTGADASHPDLEGNLVAGYNAVTGSTNYQDISYHGSHVCGIISSVTNNGVGTSGVTYNSKVIPVMSGRGSGSNAYFYSSDLSEAYQYLLTDTDNNGVPDLTEEYGMHAINMSLGGDWSETADDQAVLNYVDVAYGKDIVTVCAAGNDNTNDNNGRNKSWPADYETCVSVIALATSDMDYQSGTKDANGNYVLERAYYSDYGSCKDISAPGTDICSTVPTSYNYSTYGGYAYLSGTSMASPMVAGTVALIFAKNSGLSADEALDYMYSSALDLGDEGYDIYYGWGCIDMAAALEETPYESLVPVPAAPSVVTYNGMPQTADIPTSKFYTITNATHTDAGTYTVTVSLNDKENYTWNDEGLTTDDLQFEFVINKAAVTLAAVNASKSYGSADPILAGTISGLAKNDDLGIISFVREEGEDVGEYAITAKYTDNANYDVTNTPATFTIKPANISVVSIAFDDPYPYTGTAQTPDPIITRNNNVLVKGIDYTLRYTNNTNIGMAEVVVSGVGNYTGTTTATFEIAKAHATIICADEHKAYGAADPVLGGSVEGLISDGDLGEIVYTRKDGEDIGSYAITASYADNANYDVSVVDGVFSITQANISTATITGVDGEYSYNTHAIEPVPTITLPSGVVLSAGNDYSVSYENNKDVGTATVIIEGCGGYSGKTTCTFAISAADISDATITGLADSYTYTGAQICPDDMDVSLFDERLVEGTDYVVEYGANTDVGSTGTLTVQGKGNYAGQLTRTFEISAADIAHASVVLSDDDFAYTASPIEPVPTVRFNNNMLVAGKDYVVFYANNTNVGTAEMTLSGVGNYEGVLLCRFSIVAREVTITCDDVSKVFGEVDPVLSGTVEGLVGAGDLGVISYVRDEGQLAGSYEITAQYTANDNYDVTVVPGMFMIRAADISQAVIAGIDSAYTYTGSRIAPSGYMVAMNGALLAEDVDFSVTYGDNVSAGEGSIVFSGIGNYAGSKTVTFKIAGASIAQASVSGIDDYYVYTGQTIRPAPTVELSDGSVLRENVDYTLTYANNIDAGTATITISGIGNYTSDMVCEFKILNSFSDIGSKNDGNNWYYDAIYSLVSLGVISGYGSDYEIFGVGDPITRADFVTMLWRYCAPSEYAGYDQSAATNTTGLPDVEDGQYWTGAVNWAVKNGVVTGYDLGDGHYEFRPYASMSFEETVVVLARYVIGFDAAASYDTSVLSEPRFTDASAISEWARGSVAWAIDNGVVTGNNHGDGTYSIDPLSSVPRERMATLLWRVIDNGLVQPR